MRRIGLHGIEQFLDALSFLTRLCAARELKNGLAACLPWFAPVGLLLGAVCTLPAWLLWQIASHTHDVEQLGALLTAWLWLCLSLWLTRALHWDGLADLADACGSGAQGQRFWEILRDSRLGTFGALALLGVFMGQWLCLSWHIQHGHWIILLLVPAWGRACAVWLAAAVPACDPGSLGGMAAQGAEHVARKYLPAALLTLLALALSGNPWWQLLLLPGGQYWLIRRLARTGSAQGGISGDFLGASVELGQLWFLLILLY
ncbi:MAG: adenosylcobinamide-GDP ribazoletransferase [Desulfovibrionaceae bacterium]|nr:adenosylcobinamide-GDP ribazoletransferase [Desulfovibrionaceae bacterium]